MKYRVRVSFQYWKDESQVEAQMLMGYAKGLSSRAVSPDSNRGQANEEISFCALELCRHDEGLPCQKLERVEIRNREVR